MKRLHHIIIVDEFSKEAPKLLYMLQSFDNPKQLLDSHLKEIETTLGVSSFDEFLEKFAPTIYPVITEEGASWTFENNGNTPIRIDKNFKPLVQILNIMEKRKSSGQANIEFNWQDAFQTILPASMVEDAKALRGQLEYNTKKLNKLDKEDPQYKSIASKIIKIRKEIAKTYKDNPLNLLPLAIEDSKNKLASLGYNPNKKEDKKELPKLGYLEFGENGEIEFKELKSKEESVTALAITEQKENSTSLAIQNWLEKDYDNFVKDENRNNYVKNLVVSTFTNKYELVENINVEEVKARYAQQLNIYKTQLENSFEALNEIFTKLLGIKALFDQGNSKMDLKLIILNQTSNELAKNKKLFNDYLKSINLREFNENLTLGANIYTAVIPNIIVTQDEEENYFDVDGNIADIKEENSNNSSGVYNLGSAKELLEVLTQNKILTFINFKANKNSVFESIKMYGIEKFENELEIAKFDDKSDYIVPCYPNFTVIGDEDFKVDLRINNQDSYTYLKGIYIDAAYVAAGLVAAYLNPQGLLHTPRFEIKKSDLNMEYPGVRINLEEPTLAKKLTTSLSKESIYGVNAEIRNGIKDLNKGFIFICDEQSNYMYPLLCRNIKKQEIFKVLLKQYTQKVIFQKTNGSVELIKKLDSTLFRSWQKESQKFNAICKKNDKLEVEVDGKEYSLKIWLSKDGEVVEDLDVKLETAQD